MANNPVVNTLTFTGSVAGQASISAQGIAGGLTFLLPNLVPVQGQLLTAASINGNNVFLGWSSSQSLSGIPLSALAQSGATTNQIIEWNGSAWVPSSSIPGSGTVTSVALTGIAGIITVAGSPITTSGTLALSLATQTANTVFAGPASAGPSVPTFRALVAADIGASTVSIAAINSKRGNGGFVQLAASGTAGASGNVVTFDANGNTVDSGSLLSSFAPLASPSFTGTVTMAGDLNFTETPVATINGPSGNTLNIAGNGGLIQIVGNGAIGIAPNSGQKAAITEARLNGHLWDGTNSAGTAGQVLTSTGSISQWSNTATLQTINGVNAINALGGSGLDISSAGSDLIQINGGTVGIINVSSTGVAINNNTSGATITVPTAGGIQIANNASGDIDIHGVTHIHEPGNARGLYVGASPAGAGHIWLWSPSGSNLVDVSDTSIGLTGAVTFGSSTTITVGTTPAVIPYKVTATITSAQLKALSSFTLSAVANSVGPNADYTGTFTGVTIPAGMLVTIAGFTASNNNGVFTVVSNNATTLTVTNAAATAETHAATADTSVQILPPAGSGKTYNGIQGYANYVFGTTPYTDTATQVYEIGVSSPAVLPVGSGFIFALAGGYVSDVFTPASSQASQLANNFGNASAAQLNNQPLVFAFIFSGTGTPPDLLSGGDGVCNITVYYHVEDVA